VSKRRARLLKLITRYPAGGVPPQGGTDGAPEARHQCGRPSAETELEGKACDQAKGWGECPADRRSATPVASSLSASSAWPTSCPHRCPQKPLMHNICKGGKKKYTSKKVAKGRGQRRGHSPHKGENCANRAIKAGVGFLPDLPSATRKEQRFALQKSPMGKKLQEKQACFARHRRLATRAGRLDACYCGCVNLTSTLDASAWLR
jgi:hypothetical protein